MPVKLPPIILDPVSKKFVYVDNPGPEKPLILTEGEKAGLIKDFISVMERPPTQEEIFELVSEELKLKRGRES